MIPFRVLGTGRAHPPTHVTNADLETRLGTTDAWIRERTGIGARWVGGTTPELATGAAEAALGRAGAEAASVDALVVATSTAPLLFPGAAASVAGALGVGGAAFDLNGGCAGFVDGIVIAAALLGAGPGTVLLVGADAMTPIVDPADRATAPIFADGAGAVLLGEGHGGGLLAWDAGTDGSGASLLCAAPGGPVQMAGQAVFKHAVRSATRSAAAVLDRAGLAAGDVDLFVPHQANQRITDSIASRLGVRADAVVSTIGDAGNSSSGSIPFALSVAQDDGRLRDGMLVLLCGFGAGLRWSSALVRWAG